MLKSLTKNFVKYKIAVLIGGFLVVVIVGVFIFSRIFAAPKVDVQINVKPTLSLGPCFNNQNPPKTTIVTPADNTKYTTGDKVALSGIAVLECDNSKIADRDLSWYLDSDSAPFASGLTYSLEGLKAGDHKIRLVSLSGKLKGEATITVKFEDPKPQVLGIKTPPPAPPANNPPVAPANQKPVVEIISPKNGEARTVEGFLTELLDLFFYPITFNFTGNATDDRNANLPDANFTWYIGDTPIGNGRALTYAFTPATTCPKTLDISLRVRDLDAAEGRSDIVVNLNYPDSLLRRCPGSAGENSPLTNLQNIIL